MRFPKTLRGLAPKSTTFTALLLLLAWNLANAFELDPLPPEIARASTESVHLASETYTITAHKRGDTIHTSFLNGNSLRVNLDSARGEYRSNAALIRFNLDELLGDLNYAALEVTSINNYPGRQRVGVFALKNTTWKRNGPVPNLEEKLPLGVLEIAAGSPGPSRLILSPRTLQPFLDAGEITLLLQRQRFKTIFLDEPGPFEIASGSSNAAPRLILSRGPKTKLQTALDEALPIWRKPDANASSCADCHGPSALDLALLDYDVTADIHRRALDHVNPQESAVIGRLITTWREHLGIDGNAPAIDKFTPLFQPGGEKLPGANRLENDKIFAQNLIDRDLDVALAPINSYAASRKAMQQLLELNVWDLKVGFDMPAWTHDPAHGDQHALLTEWIPIYPSSPKANSKDFVFALHDAYLSNASNENLWQLVHWHDQLEVPSGFFPDDPNVNQSTGGAQIGLNQYLSILSVQHHLLVEKVGAPPFIDMKNPVATQWADQRFTLDTPAQFWWQVADSARQHQTFAQEFETLNTVIGFPKHELPKINSSNFASEFSATSGTPRTKANRHLGDLRAKFFWLAWLTDPATMSSGRSNATRSLEYMEQSFNGSLTAHFSLVWLKRLAISRLVPEARPESQTFSFYGERPPVGDPARIGNDPLNSRHHYLDQEHLDMAAVLADNTSRIAIFVLEHDLHTRYAHRPLKEHTLNWINNAQLQATRANTLTPELSRAITTIRNYYQNNTLPPLPVTASATFSTLSGTAPLTITATANNVAGGQYNWDHGDNTFSTNSSTTHTYSEPGSYTLQLTVLKPDGTSRILEKTVEVSGTPAGVTNFAVTPDIARNLNFTWEPVASKTLPENVEIEVSYPGKTVQVNAELNDRAASLKGIPAGTMGTARMIVKRGANTWSSSPRSFVIPSELQSFAAKRNLSPQQSFAEYAFGSQTPTTLTTRKGTNGIVAKPSIRALRPDLSYFIQRSTDLINWETISTTQPLSGERLEIEDEAPNEVKYFYRSGALPE